jgi:hypothetical protein
VINVYFAIFASAVSTSEGSSFRMLRNKVTSKPMTIYVRHKICCGASRAHPSAGDDVWHPPAHAVPGGITLDEVNDRLYARRGDAGSATTSVSFALLRGFD